VTREILPSPGLPGKRNETRPPWHGGAVARSIHAEHHDCWSRVACGRSGGRPEERARRTRTARAARRELPTRARRQDRVVPPSVAKLPGPPCPALTSVRSAVRPLEPRGREGL
jgi:hypothetical protein